MSTYVYMKVLESTPERYDRGIRLLSRGAIELVYRRLAGLVAAPGARVLDVGCGTGSLTMACAERGADVVGIDIDGGMLAVAHRKAEAMRGGGAVRFIEAGALEIEDLFPPQTFDAAVSCLLFSELTADEQAYVLSTLRTRVRAGGLVAIADEAAPEGRLARVWWWLRRAPLVVVTWLIAQTSTRPVAHLEERMQAADFAGVSAERLDGDFILVWGRVPPEDAS